MAIISGNGLKKNSAFGLMGLLTKTVSVVVCNTLTNGVSALLRVLCWHGGHSGVGFYPFPVQVPRPGVSLGGFGRSCWSPADGDALHSIRKEVTNKCVSVCLSVCLCRGRSWSCFWSGVSWVGCGTTSAPAPQRSGHCRSTSRDAAAAL